MGVAMGVTLGVAVGVAMGVLDVSTGVAFAASPEDSSVGSAPGISTSESLSTCNVSASAGAFAL